MPGPSTGALLPRTLRLGRPRSNCQRFSPVDRSRPNTLPSLARTTTVSKVTSGALITDELTMVFHSTEPSAALNANTSPLRPPSATRPEYTAGPPVSANGCALFFQNFQPLPSAASLLGLAFHLILPVARSMATNWLAESAANSMSFSIAGFWRTASAPSPCPIDTDHRRLTAIGSAMAVNLLGATAFSLSLFSRPVIEDSVEQPASRSMPAPRAMSLRDISGSPGIVRRCRRHRSVSFRSGRARRRWRRARSGPCDSARPPPRACRRPRPSRL